MKRKTKKVEKYKRNVERKSLFQEKMKKYRPHIPMCHYIHFNKLRHQVILGGKNMKETVILKGEQRF